MSELKCGDIRSVAYPFVREKIDLYDREVETWRPGVRWGPEDIDAVADGIGIQYLTIIGTYKPGRYPLRIFYTQRWEDPEGKQFGKTKLRIVTAEKFRRLANGYHHPFRTPLPSDAVA